MLCVEHDRNLRRQGPVRLLLTRAAGRPSSGRIDQVAVIAIGAEAGLETTVLSRQQVVVDIDNSSVAGTSHLRPGSACPDDGRDRPRYAQVGRRQ